MENNINRELSEEELKEIFGGMDYNLDLGTMTATVTLDEDENAADALNKLIGQLPSFVKVSATAQEKLVKAAGEMGTNGPRNCVLTFKMNFMTVTDVTYTLS